MKTSSLRKTLLGLFAITTFAAHAQNVAINTSGNTAVTGAILDLSNNLSTTGTNAFLAPYVTLTNSTVLAPVTGAGPAGLLVYNTSASNSNGLQGAGYYYWTGSAWAYLYNSGQGITPSWLITGNSNIVDGTNFLGTTTDIPLTLKVNGNKAGRIEDNTGTNSGSNTFFGYLSGNANTPATGVSNTGIGYQALKSNTTSTQSTAVGYGALSNITTGASLNTAIGYNAMPGAAVALVDNTAVGAQALFTVNNAGGSNNTAVGMSALYHATTGGSNTMVGEQAGENLTTSNNSTAVGVNSLYANVAGNGGTAIGYYAMYNANSQAGGFDNTNVAVGYQSLMGSATPANNTGLNNTAIGYKVLSANVSAGDNTALGFAAMAFNTYSKQNVAVGSGALETQSATNGNTAWATDNVAVGYNALKANQPSTNTNGYENTAVGSQALVLNTTGATNTAVGYTTLPANTQGAGNTAIGYNAMAANTTGTNNTALGYQANMGSAALTNATAIGYKATANINNSIILGQTATATFVGIGTSNPLQLLHVNGVAQLGTASTTPGSLIFANSTANSVTLNSSNSTAAAYTMTLPVNVATAADYVLASTGANGVLQWINPASFSSVTGANNGLTVVGGNVQLGGTNPLIQNTTLLLNGFTLTETSAIAGISHTVQNSTANGYALSGQNIAGSGNSTGIGVYGTTIQSAGYGLEGTNTNLFGGTGIYGTGATYGVEGSSSGSVGVYGVGSTGVEGNGTAYGLYGIGPVAVYGDANNSTNSAGGYFTNNTGSVYTYLAYYTGATYYGLYTNSNYTALGTKSTIVADKNGDMRSMYCAEAPEVLFEDYGTSSLVNGRVHIDLDPTYAANVSINEKHKLRVIVTMNDECPNGVYVTNRTATGFDVIENSHGTSNAAFTYEVIANRADKKVKAGEDKANYSDYRFEHFDVPAAPVIKKPKTE